MTEKELHKLKRYQLLEILIMQTEEIDKLHQKIDTLEAKLNEREINISKLGSIADASLYLNGVFSSAEKAAEQYLENAKKQANDIVNHAKAEADQLLSYATNKVFLQSEDADESKE